ncbi:MAG: hypothetical protein M0R17_02975 [Candidatus Omnitrophica bacterium]|jgi:DnaJ-class molecular chaperone|nr:hypothetical protein [Candidatus Omnitrophota bacterium]
MKVNDLYHEGIIICENCHGYGKTTHEDEDEWEYDITCSNCNGHGRLLITSSNKEIKDKNITRLIETKITKLTPKELKIRKNINLRD